MNNIFDAWRVGGQGMATGIQKTDAGWRLDSTITGIAIDSRLVQPGYVFVAIPGATADGHLFIRDAVERGAVAIVGERSEMELTVPYYRVPSSRQAAAAISAEFYQYPSRKLVTVGVTGTNGKTSVVYWLASIVKASGQRCGMISSVVNDNGGHVAEALLTTPESPDLQRHLYEMVTHRMSHAVIEVSSHGIAQYRVDQVSLDLAVLTNITRDHLDFHGTMDNYVATKAKLFERMKQGTLGAVINADDYYSQQVLARVTSPVITYGIQSGDLRATVTQATPWSSDVRLTHKDFAIKARLNHPGLYNVYNLAAVVAASYQLGIDPSVIERTIGELPEVPGRMQVLSHSNKPTVVIDYAHTPDGLVQSLKTVRQFVNGDVWLVFGARGGRDRGKRPEMGRIAATLADHIVLTADSPKDEDPLEIAHAIEAGVNEVNAGKLVLIDIRRDWAIRWAIGQARTHDCVVITGRGPETYQNFHNQRVHLKDADVAMEALGNGVRREGFDGIGVH